MGKLRYILMALLLVSLIGTATSCAWFDVGNESSNADSGPICADWEPIYIDDVTAKAGTDLACASKALLSLQLKKLILEIPGKQYVRKEN